MDIKQLGTQTFIYNVPINITPLSLRSGLMTIPNAACRDWNALVPRKATLTYAGVKADITLSPRKDSFDAIYARAWQFAIRHPKQLQQLHIDGWRTEFEWKRSRKYLSPKECLLCTIIVELTSDGLMVDIIVNETGKYQLSCQKHSLEQCDLNKARETACEVVI